MGGWNPPRESRECRWTALKMRRFSSFSIERMIEKRKILGSRNQLTAENLYNMMYCTGPIKIDMERMPVYGMRR